MGTGVARGVVGGLSPHIVAVTTADAEIFIVSRVTTSWPLETSDSLYAAITFQSDAHTVPRIRP